MTFTADLPRAGLYTIEAMANGVMRTEDIDASAPVPPINFVFP